MSSKINNEPIRKTITNEIGQQFTCLCEPRRTVKGNCNIYFDCKKCKNSSWYDDDYCNNQNIEGTSLKGKRDYYYCLNYEV